MIFAAEMLGAGKGRSFGLGFGGLGRTCKSGCDEFQGGEVQIGGAFGDFVGCATAALYERQSISMPTTWSASL